MKLYRLRLGRQELQIIGLRAVRHGGRWVLTLLAALVFSLGALALLPTQPAAAASNPIQVENSYPGDPTWNDFSSVLQDDAISGYGSQISINKGQSIDFFVTTTAASVTIDIYRTGWYAGVGARKMTSLGTFPGVHQTMPTPDPVTGLIACNWSKTATLTIPTTWTTGVYLAKLTASSGNKSFIFFVLRNDGGHEDFVFQTSVTTYQAYNTWGGLSLYNNNLTNKAAYPYAHATKVSFDRPFNPGDSNGAGHFLWFEYPFVRWAESQGFDITYTTNVDTHTNVNPLTNHKGFLSVGHDEYWSKGMRDNVQAAINAGVNVAFFSANTCYWQIRFEPSAGGVANRIEVGYKDFATTNTAPGPDPQWNVNNAIVTTHWRDPPVNLPENGLIGVMFEDENQTDGQPYVVSNASSWVFANTGMVNGSSVPGIVGYEYDKVFNNGFTPAGLTVLSNSPVVGQQAGSSYSNSTLYTAPSGARVFASGTIEWSYGLDNFGNRTTANPGIQKTTANILYNFNGGSPPPPPPPPPPGTYILDGFESGNLTQWTGPSGTGQATAEVTVVNSGQYAASLTNPPGSGQYVTLYQNLAGGAEALSYSRFYFRVTDATLTATLATGTDSSGNDLWVVAYDGASKGLDIYFWNGARTRYDLYSNPGVTVADTWYAVEVELNEATSGHGEVWLNGASIGAVNANLSATNAYSRMYLWNDASESIYFDDIVVSNHYNGLVSASAPAVGLSPTSLSFGNQNVGTTSAAQTVTLTNTGTANLSITSVGLSGANAGDFAKANDTCTTATVVPGATCAVGVTFTPTTGGNRSASLSFVDSAGDSPQNVSLSGIDLGPGVTLSPTSLSFGNQLVNTTSAAQTVTLTNSGNSPLTIAGIAIAGGNPGDFAQTNTCPLGPSTLAASATCTINVTFTPTASGARAATVQVTDDAPGSPQGVPVGGTGTTPAPTVSLSPTTVNFGNQAVNTASGAQTVTLANTGTTSLTISTVALSGAAAGDFAKASDTCSGSTVAVGATCTVGVTFAPTTSGSRSATLVFSDSAPDSPQSATLSGTGTAAGISLSPTSVSFGNQSVLTASVAQTVTLTNSGNTALTINSIAISGTNAADFSQTNTCGPSVAAGANCAISVTFTPQDAGSRSATLVITDNAAGSPQQVALSGTGQAADVRVDVTANKTTVRLGANLIYTITVTNGGPGSAPGITLTDVVPSGATFAKASWSSTSVTCTTPAAGATGTVTCAPNNASKSLASGASFTVTMTVNVGQGAAATITDTANVAIPSTLHYDPNLANNSAAVTTNTR